MTLNRTCGRSLKWKFSVLLVAGVFSLLAFFGEFQNKAIGRLSQYQFIRTPYAHIPNKSARNTSGTSGIRDTLSRLNGTLKDASTGQSSRKQGVVSKSDKPKLQATRMKSPSAAGKRHQPQAKVSSTTSPKRFKNRLFSNWKPKRLSKTFKLRAKRHSSLDQLNSKLQSRPKEEPLSDKHYGLKLSTRTKQYSFLLNVLGVCDRSTELVVIVCSSPSNLVKRTAIRKTWGLVAKDPKYKIRLVFLVGRSRSPKYRALLKNESRAFEDIIQKDFVDSYMNLTLKSLSMLEWVTHYCNSSKFILKADDDMYINLPNLIKALHRRKGDTFIIGHLHDKGKPVRDKKSKWFIPRKMYRKDNYPPFTVGVAYSMTTKAAKRLYAKAQTMSFFPMEDVFLTGIVASASGIPRYDHIGFYDKWRKPSCEFKKKIAEHKHSPQELYLIHTLLTGEACQ
ncbi:beta-1,3-galactosyltransferase 1-like [Haliotis rubra]|uniref:beta-1,3-galactosyltransferase 1-like n=1 Tax=Haliotis rubra TaxID=36100 RepID=UPI001EE53395|nr:beta-1,3-galactosyltransferase 1-like [Haliotis rubra]